MNQAIFTVEEENFICAFDTSSLNTLKADIAAAMPYFYEPELYEIAENTLHKLDGMADAEYATLVLSPAYYDGESEV